MVIPPVCTAPTTIALILSVVGIFLSLPAAAMTTKIDAGTKFCISEHVPANQLLTFQFNVIAGGNMDLVVDIFDSTKNKVKHWEMSKSGDITFPEDSKNQHFEICFSNEMSRYTPKWVDFIIIGDIGGSKVILKTADIDPIEKQVMELRRDINYLHASQNRLRIAEKDHRSTIEDSNDRVILWGIFEVVVLFGTVLFQIYFLKRFLERKHSV
eukprot:Tbor_TRINITY_DN4929_c5_g11::TRINITY_DN4929_c5_g11_i1::g.9735::m.9735/K20347/TMED2, EMP24; p24 family protein beta-1